MPKGSSTRRTDPDYFRGLLDEILDKLSSSARELLLRAVFDETGEVFNLHRLISRSRLGIARRGRQPASSSATGSRSRSSPNGDSSITCPRTFACCCAAL